MAVMIDGLSSVSSPYVVPSAIRSFLIGITSLQADEGATYSASIVLQEISVCNWLFQRIGHLLTVIKYPVLDLTQCGS